MADSPHAGLAEALAAFQAEAATFSKTKTAKVKTKTGGEYTYKYADLGNILPVVRPLLAKHGLSWSSKPGRDATGDLVLTFRLLHTSGEADAGEMPLGVDKGCKPQELGSAITYARRYALTAQLNLATEEDDDGQTAQGASRKTKQPAQEQPETLPADSNGQPELASEKDVAEIREAAQGLERDQIKLAMAACGLSGSTRADQVPRDKVVAVIKALGMSPRDDLPPEDEP